MRTILKTDNKEIVELCKKASIRPRKNAKGHTYFSYDEVKNLRKIQAQAGSRMVSNPISAKVPVYAGASSSTSLAASNASVRSILTSLQELETKLSDKIAKVIEVYQLKNELNSYKSVGFGLYKKKEVYVWE